MSYYYQQRFSTRFFAFKNICHNGKQLENEKLYSVIAAQINEIENDSVPKEISPFNSTPLNLSNGITDFFLLSSLLPDKKNPDKDSDTLGHWKIADQSFLFPTLSVFFPYVVYPPISTIEVNPNPKKPIKKIVPPPTWFPPINPNSPNGFSYPFDMIIQNNYFKFRYWLETPNDSDINTNQPTLEGRWIWSDEIAFTTYTMWCSTIKYNFTNNVNYFLNSKEFEHGINIDSNNYGFIFSGNNKEVYTKELFPISQYSFVKNHPDQINLNDTINNASTYKKLLAFNYDRQPIALESTSKFGNGVGITADHFAVSDPEHNQGGGLIYIYERNCNPLDSLSSCFSTTLSSSSFEKFGKIFDYKNLKNNNCEKTFELLVVSPQLENNSKIDLFKRDNSDIYKEKGIKYIRTGGTVLDPWLGTIDSDTQKRMLPTNITPKLSSGWVFTNHSTFFIDLDTWGTNFENLTARMFTRLKLNELYLNEEGKLVFVKYNSPLVFNNIDCDENMPCTNIMDYFGMILPNEYVTENPAISSSVYYNIFKQDAQPEHIEKTIYIRTGGTVLDPWPGTIDSDTQQRMLPTNITPELSSGWVFTTDYQNNLSQFFIDLDTWGTNFENLTARMFTDLKLNELYLNEEGKLVFVKYNSPLVFSNLYCDENMPCTNIMDYFGMILPNEYVTENPAISSSIVFIKQPIGWKKNTINYPNATNGYFGYDVKIQTKNAKQNPIKDFVYISEPYKNNGYVHVYTSVYYPLLNSEKWTHITSISTEDVFGYGQFLASSGSYLAIATPNALFQGVSGLYIDIYKTQTLPQSSSAKKIEGFTSFKKLSGSPPEQVVDFYYKLQKTQTIFLSGDDSKNLGKSIEMSCTFMNEKLGEAKYKNWYGDFLVIGGENKSLIYSRYFDKFEFFCEIDKAEKITIWENAICSVSGNNINFNLISE